ncbi:MAG: ferrochelatase [Thaumarchaeota archaeon]|nr:ferrochelatase [Nitrososphaerota archaeon]
MPAVILLSYGTPNSIEEVEAYYTHMRHGKKPSPEKVEGLESRYRSIGGKSPLLEITRRQAQALARKLAEDNLQVNVYVGMKHWHPFIHDVIQEICDKEHGELTAIPLAPHYSTVSTEAYRNEVVEATKKVKPDINLCFIESWHLNPMFLDTWKTLIEERLAEDHNNTFVLFTAHSIPERYVQSGDPYEEQLLETSRELVKMVGIRKWAFAYQSASQTEEKWLGPDIQQKLQELADSGEKSVLIAPIGFVSDHLEILYDIDIEAAQLAMRLGLSLIRTNMPNDSPKFIAALASLVNNANRKKDSSRNTKS